MRKSNLERAIAALLVVAIFAGCAQMQSAEEGVKNNPKAVLGAVIGGAIWKYFLEEGADQEPLVEGAEVPGNASA